MPTGPASICNVALGMIGDTDNFIDDLASDKSQEGILCNVFYDNQRLSLLQSFFWPFATRRAQLALSSEPARAGWSYIYNVPVDLVQERYIYPSLGNQIINTPVPPSQLLGVWTNPRTPRVDQRIPFVIEASMAKNAQGKYLDSKVLLTDLTTPLLVYTSDIQDTAQFSPLFSDALSAAIAMRIALPLTKKVSLKLEAQKEFERCWALAAAMALNGQQEDVVPDSEMVAGRL